MKLLDKYSELVKKRESEAKKEAKSPAKSTQVVKEEPNAAVAMATVIKSEQLDQEYQQILSKIQDTNLRDDLAKDLKSEENQDKLEKADKMTKLVKIDPSKNYFAKSLAKKEKKIDVNKLNEIKEKIKQKSLSEIKQAKEMSIEESCRILKEHEKKVQVSLESNGIAIQLFFYFG